VTAAARPGAPSAAGNGSARPPRSAPSAFRLPTGASDVARRLYRQHPRGARRQPAAHHRRPALGAHAETLKEVDAVADRANSLPKKITDEVALGRLGAVVKDARALAGRLEKLRKDEVEPHLAAQRETNGFFGTFAERLKRIGDALSTKATDYQQEVEAAKRRELAERARKLREEEDAARAKAQAAAEANRPAAVAKHEDKADLAAERAARAEQESGASAADLTRVRTGGVVATTRTTWDFEITDANLIPLAMLRPYIPRADLEKALRAFVKNNQDTVQLAGVRIFQSSKVAFR
jgi:hypothetical protein